MTALFRTQASSPSAADGDFGYLAPNTHYFDTACQTLRPQCVIDAETDYYLHRNACGGRVKYRWGREVDDQVQAARAKLLKMAGKSAKDYCVAFTLNTSYGINLVLNQLPGSWDRIITSEIEHNSVFLPSIVWAKKHGKERLILPREEDGALRYEPDQLTNGVVIVNTTSNIDGRTLTNLKQLTDDVHGQGGILLLDAAQTFGHGASALRDVPFDAVFSSGHKMYGPSIGFVIIRRDLLRKLDVSWVGGGTVSDVDQETYTSLSGTEEEHAVLELGLQNWAGIIGLAAAVDWLEAWTKDGQSTEQYEHAMAERLYNGLKDLPKLHLMTPLPSSITSLYVDGLDAHRLAMYVDEAGIMCRSGSFCCHAYLTHRRKMPPLLRLSLGLHNTPEEMDYVATTIRKIISAL